MDIVYIHKIYVYIIRHTYMCVYCIICVYCITHTHTDIHILEKGSRSGYHTPLYRTGGLLFFFFLFFPLSFDRSLTCFSIPYQK